MTNDRRWLRNLDFLKSRDVHRFIWVGLSFLFLGLFIKITWELHEDSDLMLLDEHLLLLIAKLRLPSLNGPAVDVTALGSPTIVAFITALGTLLMALNRDLRGSLYLASGTIGAGISTYVLKHGFTRPRPTVVSRLVEVSSYSYPSGHSLTATSLYLLLMFLSWRHYRSWKARFPILICTAVLITGICFSRLYLGVHYPSDVLSGAFLGAAWVCLLTAFFSRSKRNLK